MDKNLPFGQNFSGSASKIEKTLKRLTIKERKEVKAILTKLYTRAWKSLDMNHPRMEGEGIRRFVSQPLHLATKVESIRGFKIKKLRGRDDIFRVRKGDVRIIYRMKDEELYVLKIERRRESTYRLP